MPRSRTASIQHRTGSTSKPNCVMTLPGRHRSVRAAAFFSSADQSTRSAMAGCPSGYPLRRTWRTPYEGRSPDRITARASSYGPCGLAGSWPSPASCVPPVPGPRVLVEGRGLHGGADTREAKVGVRGRARPGMLAPHDGHLGPRLGVLRVDQRQREDRPHRVNGCRLVGQAREHGAGLHWAGLHWAGLHPVPGVGELESRIRPDDLAYVLGVEDQGDLRAPDAVLCLLQGGAADEIVVERDRPAVAQLVGRAVVVLDVLGEETPVERPLPLDAVQGQVVPVVEPFRVGV